jgi:Tfp pilus assembly protein PilO
MALSKRERTLLVTTIAVLVIGVNLLLVAPLVRAWRTVTTAHVTEQRQLAGYRATVAQEPRWRAEYEQLRGQIGQQVTHFQQTSDVLKKIEEVGAAAGVVITARRPLPVVERDVYRELPVQCRLDATTDSLVKFLFALRTGSGFINIEQLQISPRPDNAAILRCDILIHALAGKSEGGAP